MTIPRNLRSPLQYSFVIPRFQRVFLHVLALLWVITVGVLAYFWLRDEHVVSTGRLALNTILIVWNLALPPYFFWYASRMRRIDPSIKVPKLRVAMVVTKTPAEPWVIVRRTLEAALAQEPAHDVWLLDEAPTPAVKSWSADRGISILTRNGHPQYNNPSWPRKTKTKEGNLAYFYDMVGYENYDVVVQLDADHAPYNGYLSHILKAFNDPRVGYVAAPNLGDANLSTSWAARARLYGESVMNGSLQAGYSADGAPICIGSHYAVRTAALKASGGIGPELAEDYTTTVMLQVAGWRGAFAYDAVAHGFGPESFADLIVQDYQWAKSMTRVLLSFLPRYFLKLRVTTWPRFLLSVLWYPLLSFASACGLILPIVAVATGIPIVRVSYVYYLLFALPTVIVPMLTFLWLRRRGWLRPVTMRLVSWETALFQFARWPWTLIGCIAGTWEIVSGRPASFVVTPKGKERPSPATLLAPYIAIILLIAGTLMRYPIAGEATGYQFFLLLIGIAYLVLLGVVLYSEHQTYSAVTRILRFSTVGVACALFFLGASPTASPAVQTAFSDLPEVPRQAYYAVIGRFASAEKADQEPTPEESKTWTVSVGDHLWSIAVRNYGNGLRWTDIRGENSFLLYARSIDGTVIWPGDILDLP